MSPFIDTPGSEFLSLASPASMEGLTVLHIAMKPAVKLACFVSLAP